MARMAGDLYQSWCYSCHGPPGLDCPDRGRHPRQVRRILKRELDREYQEFWDEAQDLIGDDGRANLT